MRDGFIELAAKSNFSFLEGASHPEELVLTAALLGLSGLAVCDRNTLAGVVRTHLAGKEVGLRTFVGCHLVFADGTPNILVWPSDRQAYGRLCRLLSVGNLRGSKDDCRLFLGDLIEWCEGQILAVVAPGADEVAVEGVVNALRPHLSHRLRLAVAMNYGAEDERVLRAHLSLAKRLDLAPLATTFPLYHDPARRPLQDVLTAIRLHTTLDEAGRRLAANAERYVKPASEIARLFAAAPRAVSESLRLMDEIGFSLDELRYEYPEEPTDPGCTPQQTLARLTYEGAARRYPEGMPDQVAALIAHELQLIEALEYAPYFLTVHDIVRFARDNAILAQGRGSAANSAVCFCLGVTEVDPVRADLLFERFISPERREPPDIDVDFEHERREEVIQYIYEKYGRDRAGIAATVVTYRARSAAREIGKALGFSEDSVAALSGNVWGPSGRGIDAADAERAGLDPGHGRIGHLIRLSQEIAGFPRHLSQHVGGFVITRGRLDEMVPIVKASMDGRTTIEWDKDDLDALGILKIDVLALGMLTCLRKGLSLLARHYSADFGLLPPPDDGAPEGRQTAPNPLEGGEGSAQTDAFSPLTLASIPSEDPDVYAMICRADTLGVFQIESRAQMTMLPRLKPNTFYDLVIEVAIVRPGPIQGDMVHPYLRRRQGKERVSYPSQELKAVLSKTLGVPLFQEQAMKIAIVAAGFTPAEADQLRRAMATFKKVGTIGTFQRKMIEGMAARGYDPEFAERCFRQIEGFGEYGFPESHAASFALLVYSSSWLKCHYPDVFCAALLNSQPMGFYAPAQIVRDAREHGVAVRPVDVNSSDWDCTLEAGPRAAERLHPDHAEMAGAIRSHCAVRLGLRQVKGLAEEEMRRLVARRGAGYDSVRDVWLRTGLPRATLERLADADTFGSLGLNRREALWAARGIDKDSRIEDLPLFAASDHAALQVEVAANLPPMPPGEEVINDYRFLSLSLKAHPARFVRPALAREGVRPARDVPAAAGRRVSVAGLVLVRQRPGSAKGVIFMTVEDETGIANIIVWPKVFEAFRQVVLGARFIKVTGWVQAEDGVVHVVAAQLEDRTPLLTALSKDGGDWSALDRADEVKSPGVDLRTEVKPRSEMARLLAEVPGLEEDAGRMLAQNRAVTEALAAHRTAADGMARRGGSPPGSNGGRSGHRLASRPPSHPMPDLERDAARDLRQALPKGRNFQ
nr:error-prone DNA polymerase [Acuticoccus yangtzensis]